MTLQCVKQLYILSPPWLNELVVEKKSKYSFKHFNIVEVPRVKTNTYGNHYFKYTAAVLWNDLPDEFWKMTNFSKFKNILQSWKGNACKCNPRKRFWISSIFFSIFMLLILFF
jgi:hypothetical protein